ncbi:MULTISPECIES: hypothetical protein [Pseudomonas]|uniref:hypothetical protein n=1 Tax=Pseudomonas TaxID=286 RepID=UPI000778978C|nr:MULTISPECIES: hypothetical protein [Pseudomonas]KYC26148.1 hypothetical protein WM94_04775 [Pseudomonas sp. ABFPK]MCK2116670.1 hypothetical protein [Pseudomonas juntendi]
MAFPNSCCRTSMEAYDDLTQLGKFVVLEGRDAIGQALKLKCTECGDEWSRDYRKGGDLFWIKKKDNGQLS